MDTKTKPTTGATAHQIARAAERRYNFLMTGDPSKTHMTGGGKTWDIDAKRPRLIERARMHARYLIRPDQRIVSHMDIVLAWESITAKPDPLSDADAALANRLKELL